MKADPYPLCRKHGVDVDYERGYVPHHEWRLWRAEPENDRLMEKVPSCMMTVTVCEWGIPACDVEMWLAYATNARIIHPEEID
jgi:hypothetical protein